MSIVNCEKCVKNIDTDYDVESIVYQNDIALCTDCAIPQCYHVETRIIDNIYNAEFIKAYSLDDLKDILGIAEFDDDIRVRHDGKWETFINENNLMGWD